MPHILCAKKNDTKATQKGISCFSSKTKKKTENIRMRIEVFEQHMNSYWASQVAGNPEFDISEKFSENGKKYRIISEFKLPSGFTVPINTFVLAWVGHTFGVIDEFIDIPIRIPTFNSNDEFVYDTFASMPLVKLSTEK